MKRYPVTIHVTRDEAKRLSELIGMLPAFEELESVLEDARMAFDDAADAAEDDLMQDGDALVRSALEKP